MFDDAEILIGREFGPYRLVRELGRGGMGVVYEAHDRRLRRAVALKALPPEYAHDVVLRERLTREARTVAALSHPAIATIFALEEIDGHLFIVSEFVRGRTLREEVADGPLPRERLVSTLIEVASALAAAHQHGIVHRDLKPSNVIRDSEGHAKVLDFGIATVTAESATSTMPRLTIEGTILGTPGYMAPEQLSGGRVDARTDIFAFGVLMWELAAGEHPFGNGPAELLGRLTDLMGGRVSAMTRSLPAEDLDAIARRCLRTEPAQRYQTATELLEALRATVTPARVAAEPVGIGIWWWQFHQLGIAVLHATMPAMTWLSRSNLQAPWRTRLLFGTLVFATASVALRLNLWFISRVHRGDLDEHRLRVFPAIVVCEVVLMLLQLSVGALVSASSEQLAALVIVVAIVSLSSLALIEPATARSAGVVKRSGDRPFVNVGTGKDPHA